MLMPMPPQRVDQFNLRHCATIIGLFGVLTIISYFNELSRLGLFGRVVSQDRVHVFENGLNPKFQVPVTDPEWNVEHFKSFLRLNTTRKARSVADVSVSLHLDKKHAYRTSLAGQVNVFKHGNVLRNYFLTPYNRSWCDIERHSSQIASNRSCNISVEKKTSNGDILQDIGHGTKNINISQFAANLHKYRNSTTVLLYQHELGGYALRDCFKSNSLNAGRHVLTAPVNQNYREVWERFSRRRQNKYDAIYGSMTFGVCENVQRPCLYFTSVIHPIDRILQVYYYCQTNQHHALCSFAKANNSTSRDLYSFIKGSGNAYFKKLLYYAKQCKLVGSDQICIQDSKTSFVLSRSERKVLLNDVVQNLENWFAVVGLTDRLKDSLKLFSHVTGLRFSDCDVFNYTALNQFLPRSQGSTVFNRTVVRRSSQRKSTRSTRERLLNDPKVLQWLYADIKIYEKFVEIFQKQWKVYELLKQEGLAGRKLSRTLNKRNVVQSQRSKHHSSRNVKPGHRRNRHTVKNHKYTQKRLPNH